MRTKPFAVAALVLAASIAAVAPALRAQPAPAGAKTQAGTYKLDPVHSYVNFNIQHANAGTSWGRVTEPAGTFTVGDDGNLSAVEVTLDIAKLDTANAKRDQHLKGPDFFNAEQFPQMTFKSTAIKPGDAGTAEVTGDLTIKGTSKSITVTIKKVGEMDGGAQMGHRVGYDTEFSVKRDDFGMGYMPQMLGSDVHIWISVEGQKQ